MTTDDVPVEPEQRTTVTIDSHRHGDQVGVGRVLLSGRYSAGYEPMIMVGGQLWDRVHVDDPDGDDWGTWSYDLDTTSLDGVYEVGVMVNDITTRYAAWSPFVDLRIDNPAANVPTVTITSPADRATVEGSAPIRIAARGRNALAAVEVRVNGGSWHTAQADGDGYVFDWDAGVLGDAMASIEARALDACGNDGRSPTTYVSVGKGAAEPVHGGHADRAMWLWEGAAYNVVHNPGSRRQVAAFVHDTATFDSPPVRTVYFAAGAFAGEDMLEDLRPQLRDVVAWAHREGLQVYALIAGGTQPGFMGGLARYHDCAVREYERVLNYNLSSAPDERFDGVNIDIEPHAHPHFAARVPEVQLQWLDVLQRMKDRRDAAGSGMQFGPAMPFWLDGFTLTWRGQTKTMAQHMQDINDYVTLMDYRDHGDLIIQAARECIAYAEKTGMDRTVVVGVETGDTALGGDPELITFREEGRTWMERELAAVCAHYQSSPAFAGVALHHYDSLLELPSAWGLDEVRPPVSSDREPPTAVSAPPTASAWDFTTIDLQWGRAYDDGEVHCYRVYRSTDPDCPAPAVVAGQARDLTYTDRGLLAGTTYYYRVAAVDLAGNEGPLSVVASATTGPSDLRPMIVDTLSVAVAAGPAGGGVAGTAAPGSTATATVRVADLATGEGVLAKVQGRFTKLGGAYVTMPPTDADGRSSAMPEPLDLPAGTVGFLPHRIVASGYYWAGACDRVHSAETTF